MRKPSRARRRAATEQERAQVGELATEVQAITSGTVELAYVRLVRDFELLPTTVAGLHFLAFACLMLTRTIKLFLSP
jgi:hypothetical protein